MRRCSAHRTPRARRAVRGMTLISLMIGLLVGSLVLTALASTFNFFSAQRRQIVGGDTILQAALNGLGDIQRSVKTAGATTMNGSLLCPSINIYKDGVGTIANAASTQPVRVVASTSGSDQITVAGATSLYGTMGIRVVNAMPNASAVLKVNNTIGLAVGDLFVVGTPNTNLPCSMMQVTQLQNQGNGNPTAQIVHNPGEGGPYNPPNPAQVFSNAPSYPEGSVILKMGAFNWLTYRVTGDNLEVVDALAGTTTVIAENVVGMKVWYGTSNGISKSIEQWIPATGTWAAPTTTQIQAIRAIRIGLVVRNPDFVKPASGSTCDATANATFTLWESGPTFNVSTGVADWACYRYRTLNLVVPLRNVIYGEPT
jgi:type IV pilus assembly protein PilW